MSRETPPFAGFSGWARWKDPDARKRCSLLALWVQIIGAMAEFERSLIVERVRAGIRNARSRGKHLGRPRRSLDARRIAAMRAQGLGWKKIAREMSCGVSTVLRVGRAEEKRGSVMPAESGAGSALLSVRV